MTYIRDVVILTKSAKPSGNCVAGIDIQTGEWVRPVKRCGAITDYNMRCDDGHICEPLDVVRIHFIDSLPDGCQTENELVDINFRWQMLDRWDISDVLKIHPQEIHSNIFGNYWSSIDEQQKSELDYSLILIEVYNLKFYTNTSTYDGQKKTKAEFLYNGINYSYISVTDRDFFNFEGTYDHAYLVISMPNNAPTAPKYYKLIAKVFV